MTKRNWLAVTATEPKQAARTYQCPICQDGFYLRLDVPVSDPRFGKGVPCTCFLAELERRRAAELRGWSGMGDAEAHNLTFERFLPELSVTQEGMAKRVLLAHMTEVKRDCQEYANNPDGWLALVGMVGCGKTHLAAAICNARIAAGHGAYITTAAAMLDNLRASYEDKSFQVWLERLQGIDLLALDDLGAERFTEWAVEKMFQLLDYRYLKRKPTVITTNLGLTDPAIPARLRSRLSEAKRIIIKAGDIRPTLRR